MTTFLDAKKLTPQQSAQAGENKMKSGVRADQKRSLHPMIGKTPVPTKPAESGESKMDVTPEIKALAQELGVDLAGVKGTGKDGRITARDVRKAKAEITDAVKP